MIGGLDTFATMFANPISLRSKRLKRRSASCKHSTALESMQLVERERLAQI